MEYIVDIVMALLGLIICFSGYRFYKFAISCAGAVVGFLLGKGIISIIRDVFGSALPSRVTTAVPLIFALVIGVLAFSFYKKAFIFIVAAFVGRWIYIFVNETAVFKVNGIKDSLILIGIGAAIGLATGFAGFLIQKWAIIVMTAFMGAYVVSIPSSVYMSKLPLLLDAAAYVTDKLFKTAVLPSRALAGLLILILAVAGILVQSKSKKN